MSPIQLNEHFRIIDEPGKDPIQWFLQRTVSVRGAVQWKPISFCQTREGLLLCIREKVSGREYAGLNPGALDLVLALPDRFPKATK